MRRLAFFVLLGPPLAWLAFGLLVIPEVVLKLSDLAIYMMAVVVFYLVGTFPLLALAGIDEAMSRYQVHRIARAAVCAIIGYAVMIAIAYWLALAFGLHEEFATSALWGGPTGAIPAALCSWLAGTAQGEGAASGPDKEFNSS